MAGTSGEKKTQKKSRNTVTPRAAQKNIETIANLEGNLLRQRTTVQRIADVIADFIGSMTFVLLHILWFTLWPIANLGLIHGIRVFDPFPFVLLNLMISGEAVFLSTFVLIKQNRMGRIADERDHLTLQIDLLSEREITKALELLRLICKELKIAEAEHDPEAKELSGETAVEKLALTLRKKMLQHP